MGLDSYVYKIKKIAKEIDIETLEQLKRSGYGYVTKDSSLTRQLETYATEITLPIDEIDIDKIIKDYDLGKITGRSIVNKRYTFTGVKNSVTFDDDNKIDKYLIETPKQFLIFKSEDVAYWRKDYNISSYIQEHYPNENTEYVEIELGDLETIKEYFDSELNVPSLDEGEGLFYWEWY